MRARLGRDERLAGCLVLALAVAGLMGVPAWASDVETARRVFAEKPELPWYDAESDGFRRVEVEPPEDDPLRGSSWSTTAGRKKQGTSAPRGTWLAMIMEVLAWVLLGALILVILVVLVRSALRLEFREADSADVEVDDGESGAGRLERLPIPITRSEQDLLETARMHRRSGDYGWAVVYLFAHMLVELDRHQLIRLMRGKTNRQYLAELGLRSPLVPAVRRAMIAFEEAFFGHHTISEQRCQAVWEGLDDFQRQLERQVS